MHNGYRAIGMSSPNLAIDNAFGNDGIANNSDGRKRFRNAGLCSGASKIAPALSSGAGSAFSL
jgi:hypothetical protein